MKDLSIRSKHPLNITYHAPEQNEKKLNFMSIYFDLIIELEANINYYNLNLRHYEPFMETFRYFTYSIKLKCGD